MKISYANKKVKVCFLTDPKNNWIKKDIKKFVSKLSKKKYLAKVTEDENKSTNHDVLFILGYTKIIKEKLLNKNKYNLVIHESDLPKGKGFSPIQWQILDNKKNIKSKLIDCSSKKVDSGDVYFTKEIKLDGTELYEEWRKKQSNVTMELIKKFLKIYPNIKKTKQFGKSTFLKKRFPQDSKININKPIRSQFNLLRVCNNKRWPAFFLFKKKKYIIKIYKEK
tara:strand:- start:34900 stop:35568 length:669 start_codon:yes stop_codon:yes gene_type:complete